MRKLQVLNRSTFVVERHPSPLTGDPIRVVLSGADEVSRNTKTGNCAQVSIVHDSLDPAAAQKCGADRAVCGNCILMPSQKERRKEAGIPWPCYVQTYKSVNATYKATSEAGARPALALQAMMGAGKPVRLGAYGDPAFMKPGTVKALAHAAAVGWKRKPVAHLGYTHQWLSEDSQWIKPWAMASVETEAEFWMARGKGWRTFRIGSPGDAPIKGHEIECPHDTHGVTCRECMLCCGTAMQAKSIYQAAHQ